MSSLARVTGARVKGPYTMNLHYGLKEPVDKPALNFRAVWTGATPSHPLAVDYLAGHSNWCLGGNDRFSTCFPTWWANSRRLTTAVLSQERIPTDQEIYTLYRTQNPRFVPDPVNPREDNGMNAQLGLEYLNKVGGPDGVRCVAFAKIEPHDHEAIEAATAIFGSLLFGVRVQAATESQFYARGDWEFVPGSPMIARHAILTGGYLSVGPGYCDTIFKFVSWEKLCSMTDLFAEKLLEQVWLVVWPEHMSTRGFQEGIDYEALSTYYTQLTGRALPVEWPGQGKGCLSLLARR